MFLVFSYETYLAYFVAKKGEKNGIYTLYACILSAFILHPFECVLLYCTYFCMHVFSVVAFILQLFQVMCRCWH